MGPLVAGIPLDRISLSETLLPRVSLPPGDQSLLLDGSLWDGAGRGQAVSDLSDSTRSLHTRPQRSTGLFCPLPSG